jgi:hypothetical protein
VERLAQFLKRQPRAWLYTEALTPTIAIVFRRLHHWTGGCDLSLLLNTDPPDDLVWRYAIGDRHFDSVYHRLVDG